MMRKYIAGILVLMLGAMLSLNAQVEFFEVKTEAEMDAARKKADDSMSLLFVDVYATWCGPCKMMDRDVYANATVAQYMNTHFVNVRMDGETDFGRKYAAERGLTGYPSMYVFSDEGDFLTALVGYKAVDELLMSLKSVVDNYAVLKRYRSDHEQGVISNRDFSNYIVLLREMGNEERSEELAGEYVRLQMGENLSDYDIRAVAWYTNLGDPWWPKFTMENEQVERVLGEDYIPALEKIYNNTLVMAIDSQDVSLVSRIANELSPLVESASAHARDLRSLPFIQYYYYTKQNEALFSYVDERFAADRKGDYQWLFEMASQVVDMDQRYQTPAIMDKAAGWLKLCVGSGDKYDYYFYYGMVLFFQQQKEEALAALERAKELAQGPEQIRMVDQVLAYVRGR